MSLLSGFSEGILRKYLTWDLASSDIKEVPDIGGEERAGRRGVQEVDEGKMTPTKAMLACLEDPLYDYLRRGVGATRIEGRIQETSRT